MNRETAACLGECLEYGKRLRETMQRDREEIQRCLDKDLLKLYQERLEEEMRLTEELVRDMKEMRERNA